MSTKLNKIGRIPIARPDIGALEREYVDQAVESGWVTQGKFVDRAEAMLKERCRRDHAICCSSGTTALLATLLALEYRPSHIAVPAMTFAAVHNVVKIIGSQPVYVGADPSTWQACEWVRAGAWSSVAIMAPCYGGLHARPQFQLVIEDAAESFGGSWNGLPAGSISEIACISFYANKIVTAGEGGAILMDDAVAAARIRKIINHGISPDNHDYQPSVVGLNGRMTDMQAALLCAQLARMDTMVKRRREILETYNAEAEANDWTLPLRGIITFGGEQVEDPAPWVFAAIPPENWDVTYTCDMRDIEHRPFFPIPCDPLTPGLLAAEEISDSGVLLPLSSAMTDEEVRRVTEVIRGN